MPVPQGFVKATLAIDTLGEIPCYFNPSEYSISKSNEWSYDKVTGTSFPPAKFGGVPRLTLNQSHRHAPSVKEARIFSGPRKMRESRRAAINHDPY